MRLLLWPSGKEKLVAVLKVYCDESGINDGDDFCVIAGFVATCARWTEFERRYRQLAGADAANPGFHAKKFFARDPRGQRVSPYNDWSDERADRLFTALLECVQKVDVHPIGSLIDIKAFEQYSLDQRIFLTGGYRNPHGKHKLVVSGSPERPYYVPFQSVIMQ